MNVLVIFTESMDYVAISELSVFGSIDQDVYLYSYLLSAIAC